MSCCGNSRYQTFIDDACQYHQRHVTSLGVSDTEPVYEIAFLAQQLERAGKRGSSAMHYRNTVPVARQFHDGVSAFVEGGFIFEGRTADLDHDLHCKPSSSFHPYIRFMFCTA